MDELQHHGIQFENALGVSDLRQEVIYETTILMPKDASPVQVKDLSTVPVLSEEEITFEPVVTSKTNSEHIENKLCVINNTGTNEVVPAPVIYEDTSTQSDYQENINVIIDGENVIESDDQLTSSETTIITVDPDTIGQVVSDEAKLIENTHTQEQYVILIQDTKPEIQTESNVSVVHSEEASFKVPEVRKKVTNEEIITCDECRYTTDKKGNFYKHWLNMHSKRNARFFCCVCDYSSKTASNIRRHLLTHTDEKNFKCDECDKQFRQKAHLQRHIRLKHSAFKLGKDGGSFHGEIQCPLCTFKCQMNSSSELAVHMGEAHQFQLQNIEVDQLNEEQKRLLSNAFYCRECNFGPASQKDYKQHMKLHREGSEMKYFCEKCSYITEHKSRLDRHMLVHSDYKPFACSQCEYKATQKEHVIRHLEKVHKIYTEPSAKRRKKQSKPPATMCSREKHFVCNYCSMTFNKLINLYKHVNVQHAEFYKQDDPSQFACVICSYKSANWNNMLVHMRKHSFQNVKDDSSEIAETSPGMSKVLSNSSESTEQVAYTCLQCDFVSDDNAQLQTHLLEEHQTLVVQSTFVSSKLNGP